VVAAPADWLVLLRDRLPADICWEEFEQNQAQLHANRTRANRTRADTLGAVREGPALLTRLVVCAHCGRHMAVSYAAATQHYAYECARMRLDYGAERCQHLAGAGLDAWVSQQVLAAVAPAALELSLQAAAHIEQERADLTRLRQQQVERATYAAERAGRQYHAVEPENRLVARRLEREWEDEREGEERRVALRHAEEESERFVQTPPRGLTAEEREAIRQLAADIAALWHAPTTTPAERKALIGHVVQRVLVAVQGERERVLLTIDWVGGARTDGKLVRPVARLEHLSYYPQLCARVRELAADGLSSAAIAQRLNAEGDRPPKRREHFGAQGVQDLFQRLGARTKASRRVAPAQGLLGSDEWGLRELAQAIGMPYVTLYNWRGRGWVTARRDAQAPHRWILWADAAEVERLRQLHRRALGDERHHDWYPASPLALEHATDRP